MISLVQDKMNNISRVEFEENLSNVQKQRNQQLSTLLQKISIVSQLNENLNKQKCQEQNEKQYQYVFSLFNFYQNDWSNFTEQDDVELGNCYKIIINKLNIFKNILRAFYIYMKNQGDDIVIECLDSFQQPIQKVKKEFIRFFERHPANNKSIAAIFKYDRYGRQFEYFLNFYVVDWLVKSKTKDIIPHLLSIFFLIRCFKTPQLKEQLKIYKKQKKITLPRKTRKSDNLNQEINKEFKFDDNSSTQTEYKYSTSESLNIIEDNSIVKQYEQQLQVSTLQTCSTFTSFDSIQNQLNIQFKLGENQMEIDQIQVEGDQQIINNIYSQWDEQKNEIKYIRDFQQLANKDRIQCRYNENHYYLQ